jgi:hypothetical protein
MYIYLDESGDLGFDFAKRKTTKKFVITLLVCHTDAARREFRKAVRRTLKNKLNKKKHGTRSVVELKGASTTFAVKRYFFRHIKSNEWGIYSLVLNKPRVDEHLRTRVGKKKLYNFLSRFLLEKMNLGEVYTNVELVVDRSKNKEEIKDFNQYLINQVESLLPLNTAVHISHLTSEERAELQAADLFSWGIFRKHEYGDYEWYRVFGGKISFETEYLRDEQTKKADPAMPGSPGS